MTIEEPLLTHNRIIEEMRKTNRPGWALVLPKHGRESLLFAFHAEPADPAQAAVFKTALENALEEFKSKSKPFGGNEGSYKEARLERVDDFAGFIARARIGDTSSSGRYSSINAEKGASPLASTSIDGATRHWQDVFQAYMRHLPREERANEYMRSLFHRRIIGSLFNVEPKDLERPLGSGELGKLAKIVPVHEGLLRIANAFFHEERKPGSYAIHFVAKGRASLNKILFKFLDEGEAAENAASKARAEGKEEPAGTAHRLKLRAMAAETVVRMVEVGFTFGDDKELNLEVLRKKLPKEHNERIGQLNKKHSDSHMPRP
jgi:hypothetical protein